ncbi:MAG: PTS transporter subunit EIIA [Planctomycetes bacterium]|nr:PTS transporter subunit EIIA [Planctomycetota bacterium]
MRLRVRDAAELLNVSEKTIYRWIARKILPVHRVNEQYRFNRAELLEWASAERISISPKMLEEPEDAEIPTLAEALRAGGIHYRVGGTDKPSALRHVVEVLPLPGEVDREFLLQVLLARESVGSTAIGAGIAIPHVRNPITLHVAQPIVALCFLEHGIDFQAMDGRPVHTLFTIVSPTIRAHLNLLSKLAYGLKGLPFAEAVAAQASREEIFQAAMMLDERIAATTSAMAEPRA